MRAQSAKEQVQGVRRGEHLPARSEKEHMQGVRRGQHLPARSAKEQMQDLHSRQGRVHAAGSRGALIDANSSFCPGQCHLPPVSFSREACAISGRALGHDMKAEGTLAQPRGLSLPRGLIPHIVVA